MLAALKRLTQAGLDASVVIAAFHKRRVLPLMSRRYSMYDMKDGTAWEGTRMAPEDLDDQEILERTNKAAAANPVLVYKVVMRPDPGYISVVRPIPLPDTCFPRPLVFYPHFFLRRGSPGS